MTWIIFRIMLTEFFSEYARRFWHKWMQAKNHVRERYDRHAYGERRKERR